MTLLNGKLYYQQLDRVRHKLNKEYVVLVSRDRALLQQDNASPHTAQLTDEKFKYLDGVEIYPHVIARPMLFRVTMANFDNGEKPIFHL